MAQESGIKTEKVYSKITVDSVTAGQFQKKGTLTAQIRQEVTVTSTYPASKVGNDLSDNLFGDDEYADLGEGKTYTNKEVRVTWLDVPAQVKKVTEKIVGGKKQNVETFVANTKENVASRISENATIYKILSNHPILTEGQEAAISKGLKTKEEFAAKQIVRYPEASEQAGELTLDTNGKVQYRRCFFSKIFKEDVDYRTEEAQDQYLTEDMENEVALTENQTLD